MTTEYGPTAALETYDMLRDFGRDELRCFESAAATLAVERDIDMREARDIVRVALAERGQGPVRGES